MSESPSVARKLRQMLFAQRLAPISRNGAKAQSWWGGPKPILTRIAGAECPLFNIALKTNGTG